MGSPYFHLQQTASLPSKGFFKLVFNQADQSEIIFMGTGISEGIPRLSCLTNPSNKCPVCSKAVEPGNKSRRLNTGLLICYRGPSGRRNILIDVGKFFYHSALQWFPASGLVLSPILFEIFKAFNSDDMDNRRANVICGLFL